MLRAVDLHKRYTLRQPGMPWRRRNVDAVAGVSLSIAPGEALGLVGESGCGKSTLARLVAGLESPTRGQLLLGGHARADRDRADAARATRDVQMVFQDPLSSLNPRKSIGRSISDPLRWHGHDEQAARRAADELLETVKLGRAFRDRLPHTLSGGQRQRVCVARALALTPKLLVLDEPLSALDVSVQAHMLNLLADLQRDLGLGLLLISHDLHAVRWLCERVAVMDQGRIVETGPTEAVLRQPGHATTQRLINAMPTARRTHDTSIPSTTGRRAG